MAALTSRHPAVVAVAQGRIIGSAVSRVEGDRAWLLRLAMAPEWRGRGLGTALLGALEHRLVLSGVHRLSAILPEGETGSQAFLNNGFTGRGGVTYFEKTEMVTPQAAVLLAGLGGAVPEAGLWERVAGMSLEKQLIDTFSNGKSATFIVFQTPEEGIGIPVALNGFKEGFAALPR